VIYVCGSVRELGGWNPHDALAMQWSEGHVWFVDLELSLSHIFDYKYFLSNDAKSYIRWEPGRDRRISLAQQQQQQQSDARIWLRDAWQTS